MPDVLNKFLSVDIQANIQQNGVTRRILNLPKNHCYKKVKILIHTDFTQADIDAVFNGGGTSNVQAIITHANEFLADEQGNIIIWG